MRETHKKPSEQKFINANRRGFLQGAAIAGGAAASGVVAAADVAAVSSGTSELPSNGKGYEETDHVKKYYQRARF